jgi:hypothetical protein
VYSEPNQGATFKVYLPRVNEALDVVPPPPPLAEPTRGSETILLAEDEAPLRKVVQQILARQARVLFMSGYTDDAVVHHGIWSEALPFSRSRSARQSWPARCGKALDNSGSRIP